MPPSSLKRHPPTSQTWQQELAQAIDSIEELAAELGLSAAALSAGQPALQSFSLRVPRGFVRRMAPGDPRDPLLLQVLPGAQELVQRAGFVSDPLAELPRIVQPGLLQKYAGRALLLATGACAVHCRYCFRRAFPYAQAALAASEMDSVVATIADDRSLEEIILSGGDPLTLSNSRLHTLFAALGRIRHLRRIRVHSRLPVVLPGRVDDGLISAMQAAGRPLVIVLHSNHANEIDESVALAAARLARTPAVLLNQSVLLRGVNDDSSQLVALSERLFDIGVQPYYLHQLDPVQGAAHFRVGERRARQLVAAAAARLPGYLVPRLVRERPGLPFKEPIGLLRHNSLAVR